MNEDKQAQDETDSQSPDLKDYPGWLRRLSLAQALCIVIGASVLIVSIGYGLYWGNRDRKYDIARPDQKTTTNFDVSDIDEDVSKPIDTSTIKQKIKFIQQERAAIEGMNNLDVANLSDEDLLLILSSKPSL